MADNYDVKDAAGATVKLTSEQIAASPNTQVPTHLHYMPSAAPSGLCDAITNAALPLVAAGQEMRGPTAIRYDPTSGPEPIWIGDSGVAVGAGYPLYPGESAVFYIDDLQNLYAITAGANKVAYWGQTEGV